MSALAHDGAVNIDVAPAEGESHRILRGISPVLVLATYGRPSQPFRDPYTGLFRVRVARGADGTAPVRIAPAPPAK